MKTRSTTALTVAILSLLTGCTGAEPSPTKTTPQPSPTSASPRPIPPPPTPASPPPTVPTPTTPPVEPIVQPEHAAEITRTDAYELCRVKVDEYANSSAPRDPRDTYASLSDSYVEAVDGIWRVWIPGVMQIPDQGPANVAQTCAVNGYIDNPTWFFYGETAADYFPDRDAYFDSSLQSAR